jgi:hypothetical protein
MPFNRRHIQVHIPRYVCGGDRGERGSGRCQTVGSLRLDRAIVNAVLKAIQPVGIEAALAFSASNQAGNAGREGVWPGYSACTHKDVTPIADMLSDHRCGKQGFTIGRVNTSVA